MMTSLQDGSKHFFAIEPSVEDDKSFRNLADDALEHGQAVIPFGLGTEYYPDIIVPMRRIGDPIETLTGWYSICNTDDCGKSEDRIGGSQS